MRPQTFEEFIGNTRAVNILKQAALASMTTLKPAKHMGIIGPHGLGKTTLVNLFAKTAAGNVVSCVGNSVADQASMIEYVLKLGLGDVWFIDEFHEVPTTIQNAMLPLIEQFKLDVGTRSYNVPPFTLILATTDPGRIIRPVQSRLGYIIDVFHYEAGEIETMLRGRLDYAPIDEQALKLLVSLCRGEARQADDLIEQAS